MLWQNADHLADRDCEIRKTKQGEKRAYIPKHWKGKSQITWRRSADWPHVLTPGKIYYTMARVNFYLWLLFTFFGGHFSCSNKPLLVKYHVTFCQGQMTQNVQVFSWCKSRDDAVLIHSLAVRPSAHLCTNPHTFRQLLRDPWAFCKLLSSHQRNQLEGTVLFPVDGPNGSTTRVKDTGYLKEMIPLKRCTEIVIQLKKLGWHCFTTNMSNEDLPNGFLYKRLDIGLSWWKMTYGGF